MKNINLISCIFIALLSFSSLIKSESTILKDYVYNKDSNYQWTFKTSYVVDFGTIHVLELVSQEWMKNYTDSSIWRHWVSICVPKNVEQNKVGLLYINGGAYNQDWTIPTAEALSGDFGQTVCQESNAITVTLYQVPNQYIIFDDGIARQEDDIVAYSWHKYLDTKVSTWVSLLPQTKSAIAAMDAVQDFGNQNDVPIEKFVVFGASKRGWTTYGVAMVGDSRVAAIIPLVIGVGSLIDAIKIQYQAFGNWSFALAPYVNQEIPSFLDTDYFDVITEIVDPLNYVDTMESIPKLIVLSLEDEFFLPESTKYYYDKIKGEKGLKLYQTDHNIIGFGSLSNDISNYFKLIVNNQERPQLEWEIIYSEDNNTGTINMNVSKGTPTSVTIYQANTISTTKRDFRKYTCATGCPQDFTWSSTDIELKSDNQYSFTLSKTGSVWTAFYFEVIFADNSNLNSELAIVPNTLPFSECPNSICASGVPTWVNSSNSSSSSSNNTSSSLSSSSSLNSDSDSGFNSSNNIYSNNNIILLIIISAISIIINLN